MPRIGLRPSKEKSILAMIGSFIMLGIGVFIVIPKFGSFGILWTVMALAIGIYHAYLAFSEKSMETEVHFDNYNYQQNDIFKQTPKTLEKVDIEDRLKKLTSLKTKNLITDQEYQEKREEIIRDL